MFGNFAKIERAAGASPIWQISKHYEYYITPNCTSNIACMITCLLLAGQNWILLNVNIILSRQSQVLPYSQPNFGAFVRIFI
jgi:hypothetical protein